MLNVDALYFSSDGIGNSTVDAVMNSLAVVAIPVRSDTSQNLVSRIRRRKCTRQRWYSSTTTKPPKSQIITALASFVAIRMPIFIWIVFRYTVFSLGKSSGSGPENWD
jgi:hypothetical protein